MLRLSIMLLCSVLGAASWQNGISNVSTPQAATQAGTPLPSYDVVSIKPVKGEPSAGGYGDCVDGFWMRGLVLKALISEAFDVRDDQISGGPGWISSMAFDIEAKLDPQTAAALQKLPKQQQEVQRRLMLQSLLADRFRLQVHRATELRTTYELVLAKNGLKMKENNAPTDMEWHKWQEGVRPSTDWSYADGRISGHAEPMSMLTQQLGNATGSVVADKTGLTGRYDVLLHWDPSDPPAQDSTEPSLFTAVEEELGLRLKPTKTEFQKVIIDHIEMPSPN
jgi:uncharacterized protein (TIGR03435 family)